MAMFGSWEFTKVKIPVKQILRELLSRGQFLEIIGGRSLKFTAADQVIRLRQFREGLHFRPRPAGPPDKVTHGY